MIKSYIFCLQEIQNIDTGLTEECPYEPPYTLLINEVNLDNPGPNRGVFIELEAVARGLSRDHKRSDLHGFLFLIVRGDPLAVVLSVDVGAAVRRVTNNYVVIGTKDTGGTNIDLTSTDVASIYGRRQPLPDFDDCPYSLMVLYTPLESILGDLSLEKDSIGTYKPLNLNNDARKKELIRDHLVDMVVVARKAPTNQCGFFESLKPAALVNPKYKTLLRDWDGPTTSYKVDLSLSRCCGDKRPNDQDCWRL